MVFMDINMPEMDGVSATKELLRLQKEQGLYSAPIVALTANSISGDREKYIEAGMDDYLSKPIEFEKLVAMIRKHLRKEEQKNQEHHESKESGDTLNVAEEYKKSDAMKQLGLDAMTIDMLLDNFFLTLEEDLAKLKTALDSKECDAVYKAAHYIKGSCLNLAMNEAGAALYEIEKNAKNGVCEEVDFARVVQSFENVKRYL